MLQRGTQAPERQAWSAWHSASEAHFCTQTLALHSKLPVVGQLCLLQSSLQWPAAQVWLSLQLRVWSNEEQASTHFPLSQAKPGGQSAARLQRGAQALPSRQCPPAPAQSASAVQASTQEKPTQALASVQPLDVRPPLRHQPARQTMPEAQWASATHWGTQRPSKQALDWLLVQSLLWLQAL